MRDLPASSRRQDCVSGWWRLDAETNRASGVLSDMIARIERRVTTIKHFLSEEQLGLPGGLSVPRSKIAEARDFVASGAVGYALITGKKPLAFGESVNAPAPRPHGV